MGFTWKLALLSLILPILVCTYEFILNQSTVVVEAIALEIRESSDPQYSGYLLDFEVTSHDNQKEKASMHVENDQVINGKVASGNRLSLLYNPNFLGESYRTNQPISRWIFTIIGGVISGNFFILAALTSLVRWVLHLLSPVRSVQS